VSLDGRGSGQSDSVGCEPRHCASKDTLSEPDLAHVCKCVLGRQQVIGRPSYCRKKKLSGQILRRPSYWCAYALRTYGEYQEIALTVESVVGFSYGLVIANHVIFTIADE
jgi:hypothetical protein